MEMISVGSFIYLLVYPITWYNTLVIPLSLWCKWSICLYFTCMASPFPDLYNKCLGLFFCFVFLSPDIMTRSKTLSWLFICSSQNTALKGVLFVIKYKIFPNFSCGAALKWDLLFRPFMSLACSLIFLSLFFLWITIMASCVESPGICLEDHQCPLQILHGTHWAHQLWHASHANRQPMKEEAACKERQEYLIQPSLLFFNTPIKCIYKFF